ncbi:MAG: hypothetical protein JRI41_10780 [Deltaproteobacteria bacterium]|nr:hypothetical protein [Deltaproteobacteria bacterium]
MKTLLEEYKKIVSENRKVLLSTELQDGLPDPNITLTNNDLLIETLLRLFADEKAEYLPSNVPHLIQAHIEDVKTAANGLQSDPNGQASYVAAILKAMDKLYAHCLKYGLVTFGFTGKEEAQIVQNVRNRIVDLRKKSNDLSKIIVSRSERMEQETEEYLAALRARLEEAASAVEDIRGLVSQGKDIFLIMKQAQQETVHRLDEFKNLADEIDRIKKASIDSAEKINQMMKTTNEYESDTKAKMNSANDALSRITEKETEINDFYGKIQEYINKIGETKISADEYYTNLKGKCEKTVSRFEKKTEEIVLQNQDYQRQIKEILAKAVGAGLFRVFKLRRNFLAWSRFIWIVVVIAASVGVVWGIYNISTHITNTTARHSYISGCIHV